MSGTRVHDDAERFYSMGARILGILGVLLAVVVVAVAVFDRSAGIAAWVAALMIALGVVVYAAMVRQVLVLTPRTLVLRNMFDTTTVSLTAIDDIAIRQMLAVRVDGKRYVSAAVGRSVRQLRRDNRGDVGPKAKRGFAALTSPALNGMVASTNDGTVNAGAKRTYESLVEEKIRSQREIARSTPGQDDLPPVVRVPAWPEIVVAVVSVVATVVLFVAP